VKENLAKLEKLAKLVPAKTVDKEEVEPLVETRALPTVRLLLIAAVISLVVVGVTTLFFVLFRPVEEEATVPLPTEYKPGDEKVVDEKPVDELPVDVPTA
jgi:hypothetical protein